MEKPDVNPKLQKFREKKKSGNPQILIWQYLRVAVNVLRVAALAKAVPIKCLFPQAVRICGLP